MHIVVKLLKQIKQSKDLFEKNSVNDFVSFLKIKTLHNMRMDTNRCKMPLQTLRVSHTKLSF